MVYSAKTVIRNNDWQNTITLSFADMKAAPLSVRPYNDIGGHYYYKGDLDTAVYYYEEGLKVMPTTGTGINNLGFIYFEKGPVIFWEDYQQGEINQEASKQFLSNGNNMLQKGEHRAASFFYNRAMMADPNSVDAYNTAADLYFNVGLIKFADELYNKVLDIDPENDYAIRRLSLIEN